MSYTIPDAVFSGNDALIPRVKQANQLRELFVKKWRDVYESFWQTPRTHGDRALTIEQMQQVILANPAVVADMLKDSAGFLEWITTAHPDIREAPEGEEPLLPARYLSSPYEWDPEQPLKLISLKPEWDVQEDGE